LRFLSHAAGFRQVDWLTEPLAFIQPGEILPCCCRAKGDIEIEM
jgi:ferredoxin